MTETLANVLRMLVEIMGNHAERIKLLEEGESAEDNDDASLMEELNSLVAQLQIHQSAEPITSEPIASDPLM